MSVFNPPVENYDNKKKAYIEGLKRIDECQKVLGDKAKISLIGGNAEEPVIQIRIDGIIETYQLKVIYDVLRNFEHP